jgi:hypothetical protein
LCRADALVDVAPKLLGWNEGEAPLTVVASGEPPFAETHSTDSDHTCHPDRCNLSLQTMQPLAAHMGTTVLTEWLNNDYKRLTDDILGGRFDKQKVALAWHHSKLHDMATQLGCGAAQGVLDEWESSDEAWMLSFDAVTGECMFSIKTLPPDWVDDVCTTAKVMTTTDATCAHGILNRRGDVCCASKCGSKCGGSGCAERPGGASSCCSNSVRAADVKCADAEAPCILNVVA